MADITNLTQFLTDVATAIKQKTGKEEKIPAADFDTEILSIETGGVVTEKLYLKDTFTTDTYTSADMFVQAENSTGFLSPVYITDVHNNFIGIISCRSSGSSNLIPRVYAYDEETRKFSNTYTNLTVSTVDKNYSDNNVSYFEVASSVWNGKYCYVLLTNKAKIYYVIKLIKNSSGKLVIDTSEWWKYTLPSSMFGKTGVYFGNGRPMFSINDEKRIASIVSFGGGTINTNQRTLVSITLTDNINEEYGYKEMSVNYTAITNYGSSDTLMPILLNNDKVCVISMGYTGSTTRKSQIIIFDDNFTPIKCNEYSYKILAVNNDCTKMIAGTSLYDLDINYSTGNITTSIITSISGFNNLDIVRQSFDGSKYYTYSNGSSTKAYSYSIDWNTGSMTLLNTYNSNRIRTCGTIPGNYGMVIVDSKSSNTVAYFDIHFDVGIQFIIYKDNKYYNTNDTTAMPNDLAEGKTAYANGEKVTGLMKELGQINITPSTESQTIDEGHITGCTVSGDENLIGENIIKGKSIFGVEGTAESGGIGVLTQEEYDKVLKTAKNILYGAAVISLQNKIKETYHNAVEMEESHIVQNCPNTDISLVSAIQNNGNGGVCGSGFTIGIIVPGEDIDVSTSGITFDKSSTGIDGSFGSWLGLDQALSDVYETAGILDKSNRPKDYTFHAADPSSMDGYGYYYPDTLKANNAYPVMLSSIEVVNYVRINGRGGVD